MASNTPLNGHFLFKFFRYEFYEVIARRM